MDGQARSLLVEIPRAEERIAQTDGEIGTRSAQLKPLQKQGMGTGQAAVTLDGEIELLRPQLDDRGNENRGRTRALRGMVFERVPGAQGEPSTCYAEGSVPSDRRTATAGASRRWCTASCG